MSANEVSAPDDTDMVDCDGEKVVTMMDVLQEQQEFEEDANAVLGASDDKNCTYSKGYIKRQAVYACLTCCVDAKMDPSKRAGVCLACSLTCHENHELVELYTKRNFRCDCGNHKFNNHPCQFTANKNDLNEGNSYNQNFSGVYCVCHRPYPDPEATFEDEMIQCIICEDWLHASHLEANVPANDQYSEMICKVCMEKNEFLHDYSNFVVNTESEDVDVINGNLDVVNISDKNTVINASGCNSTLNEDKLAENIQSNINKENEQDVNMTNIVKDTDVVDKGKDTGVDVSEKKVEENTEKAKNVNNESVHSDVENSDKITENIDLHNTLKIENTQERISSELDSDSKENTKSEESEFVKQSTNNESNAPDNSESCDKINVIPVSECIESNNKLEEKIDEPSNELEKSVAKDIITEHETEKKVEEINDEQVLQEDESETCMKNTTVVENPGHQNIEEMEEDQQKTTTEKEENTSIETCNSMLKTEEEMTLKENISIETENSMLKTHEGMASKENVSLASEKSMLKTDNERTTKESGSIEPGNSMLKTDDELSTKESDSIKPEKSMIKADNETTIEKVKQLEQSMNISVAETLERENSNISDTNAEKTDESIETSEIKHKTESISDIEKTAKNSETLVTETEQKKHEPESLNTTDAEKEHSMISSIGEEENTETKVEPVQTSVVNTELLTNDDKLTETMMNNENIPKLEVTSNNDVEEKSKSIIENITLNESPKESDKTGKTITKQDEISECTSLKQNEAFEEIPTTHTDDTTINDKTENAVENVSSNPESKPNEIVNEVEMKDNNANSSKQTDCENKVPNETLPVMCTEESSNENKRKLCLEENIDEFSFKKPKLHDIKSCTRPKNVKKVFKGATFWPSNFRQKLCTCNECITMYKDLSVLFLIDLEDTVTAYEALGKEKTEGTPATQYEKGLQALSSLDRIQQINALTEYNKMRDKLLDFLKSFKDRKEIVKEEDIKAFFAGMKPKREPDGVYFCR